MCKYISKSVKKLLVEICQVVHSGNKRKYAKYPWKIHAIFPFLLDVLFCGRAHRNFLVEFCCCVLSLFLRSWKCKLRMTHLTFLLGKLWEAFFFARRDYCHWIWFWSLLRDRSSMIDSMQNMSLVIMWQKDWCKKVDHVKPKPSFKNTWASKEQKHHEHHPVSVTREDIQRRENLVTKPLPIKIKTSQLNLRSNGTNFPKDNRNE